MPTLRRQMLRRKTLRTLEIRNSLEIRRRPEFRLMQRNRMQDRPLVTARVIRHLEQIGEISGLDLDDPDVRLACSIALRLHERE